MSKPDGGPAFAQFDYHVSPGGDCVIDRVGAGMTLRDYFAAQALCGMFARDTFDPGQWTPAQRAHLAYLDADAMLAERAK